MSKKALLFIIPIFLSLSSIGQIENFKYKRPISGIHNQWHSIILPIDIFDKSNVNLSDIRIYGINNKNETIEAAYYIKTLNEKKISTNYQVNIINESKKNIRNFITIELPNKQVVNSIQLDFNQQNFNWTAKLEGTNSLGKWFTISTDNRLVSIKNSNTNYSFTKMYFKNSKYKYYRISFVSIRIPSIKKANIVNEKFIEGDYFSYKPLKIDTKTIKKEKKTKITLYLAGKRPIYSVQIFANNSFDFYRPYSILKEDDSVRTKDAYRIISTKIQSGTLSSFEKTEINLNNRVLKNFSINIYNNDNEPLTIDSVKLLGAKYKLIARFTQNANYFLVYGNKSMQRPNYEIENFKEKLPTEIDEISLGEEIIIKPETSPNQWPLNINKNWLWAIMVFIILVLGGFSVNMFRKKI